MTRVGISAGCFVLAAAALWAAAPASAQLLTADRAVELALRNNAQVVNAEAGVLTARGGSYLAYSGVLPTLSAGFVRGMSETDAQTVSGIQFDENGTPVFSRRTTDSEGLSSAPRLSATWTLVDLSSWSNVSSARNGLRAAQRQRDATRNDVALSVRRQFYEVVRAIQLAQVSEGALRLARDDERRVRALFEVGSVSRSDLLRAQVRSSQAQLDSMVNRNNVLVQRITLANLLAVRETEMGDVDSTLAVQVEVYDESAILVEAASARPDLKAAEAEVRAARMDLRSSNLSRLPSLSASAQMDLETSSRSIDKLSGVELPEFRVKTDREVRGQLALNWDLFNGFATESRIANSRARMQRAVASRDELQRNLAGEVRQTLLAYNQAIEGQEVARRTVESATENLKLTQEKYNVGSSTILELIDAQVQLQRAQSDLVSALSAIRVAEAQINRVRGRAE